MKIYLFVFVCVIFLISGLECANILCLFAIPSKSHNILAKKLAEGLIKRGHHVTLANPFDTEQMENFTLIQLNNILKMKENYDEKHKKNDSSLYWSFSQIIIYMEQLSNTFWDEPAIQKIIIEKPKYDVVIVTNYLLDGLLGIAHHLGVPVIGFNQIGSNSIMNSYTANPNMVYTSSTFFPSFPDNFLGRLSTVAENCLINAIIKFQFDPMHNAQLKKYLPNSPSVAELRDNVSLILVNSHVSIESPRPYVPNMIQIGGFHVQETKELPTDIKNFLDDAKEGAILFSLGSNVHITQLDQEKLGVILKVLGDMAPIRVVFKSEVELKDSPNNIMVKKWLPQADILAHPNIKVFICHGGLGGNTESIYHGVPILGMPFYGDQKMNIMEAVRAGYAEVVEYAELTDLFQIKLETILNEPKYSLNAKKRSALMKDQPVKPMDNAIFWIEHIIKYGNGSHLRNFGMDLTWYQLYMVDIYVFCTVILGLFLSAIYYMIKFSTRLVKRIFYKNIRKIKTT